MLIDWFTVSAQVLNFLILVWLMKRFLYKPILNAIDAREKGITKELADADAKKVEAQQEREKFQQKNEQFDQQRASLLSKAKDEAKIERKQLLDEARKTAEAFSAKQQDTLRSDIHNLNQAISRRTQNEVFAIARKTLMDLSTVSLEEQMSEIFTQRILAMDETTKASLGEALTSTPEPAILLSALVLSAKQRTKIQEVINETFSTDIHLQFETAPELISGIELTTNGQKVAWSIADYLATMKEGISELIKEKGKPKATTTPKSESKAKASSEQEPTEPLLEAKNQ